MNYQKVRARRGVAWFKLGQFGASLRDATAALALVDPIEDAAAAAACESVSSTSQKKEHKSRFNDSLPY